MLGSRGILRIAVLAVSGGEVLGSLHRNSFQVGRGLYARNSVAPREPRRSVALRALGGDGAVRGFGCVVVVSRFPGLFRRMADIAEDGDALVTNERFP